jgi:nitrogen regulatory protein P-II 2
MKIVMAIINPFKFDEARDALIAVEVHGMTATEVKGYVKNHTAIYRGAEYAVSCCRWSREGLDLALHGETVH